MNVYAVKLYAKACLAGRTGSAVRMVCGRILLSVLLGLGAYLCRRTAAGSIRSAVICAAAEGAILFLSAWLLSALRQGSLAWHIRCTEGKEPSCIQVLYWLRHLRSLKSGRLLLAVRLLRAAWFLLLNTPCFALLSVWVYARRHALVTAHAAYITLAGAGLCAIPGILFAFYLWQQYDAAAYLLAKDPSLSVREAIRASKRYMAMQCGRMFRFKLSFLPWFLSCVFILPIGFVVPYYRQSVVCMLSEILRANSNAGRQRI